MAEAARPTAVLSYRGKSSNIYFKESTLPIYSALLVLPFLLIYEIGIVCLRSDTINGGDAIVINMAGPAFHQLGVSGGAISLIFLVGFFLVWQYRRRGPWGFKPPVLMAMFFESLFYAVLLFLMLQFLVHHMNDDAPLRRGHAQIQQPSREVSAIESASAYAAKPVPVPCARPSGGSFQTRDLVLYLAARRVFEEFVFRALLLGLLLLVPHQTPVHGARIRGRVVGTSRRRDFFSLPSHRWRAL